VSTESYSARGDYKGSIADQYLAERQSSEQWQREQEVVEEILRGIAPGSRILDVPFGTGRFLRAYVASGLKVVGLDVSRDMFSAALEAHPDLVDALTQFTLGDAAAMPLGTDAVDYVVSTRFMNWLPASVFTTVMTEVGRVSRKGAIIQVHTSRPVDFRGMLQSFAAQLGIEPVKAVRALLGAVRVRLGGRLRPEQTQAASSDYFFHLPEDVERAFASADLAVRKQHRVRSVIHWLDGCVRELSIFELEPRR
jgi:ubiquinone/menaquinone biosynthesis C-methylase UbiE